MKGVAAKGSTRAKYAIDRSCSNSKQGTNIHVDDPRNEPRIAFRATKNAATTLQPPVTLRKKHMTWMRASGSE